MPYGEQPNFDVVAHGIQPGVVKLPEAFGNPAASS
jgi:hypothetical protein